MLNLTLKLLHLCFEFAHYLLLGLFVSASLAFSACSSEDEPQQSEQPEEEIIEAPHCEGTVKVYISNEDEGASRASSTIFDINRYTATCIDNCLLWNKSQLALVGYHGLNGEQIGMVQIIDPNQKNKVLAEFNTVDARVNSVQYCKFGDKHYAVVGLDRKGNDGILCGIVLVEMRNQGGKQYFYVDDQTGSDILVHPYKVSGISVNSIEWPSGSSVLFTAAGGNVALGEDGLAGFNKFGMYADADGNTRLTVLAKKENSNNRGYYINYDNESSNGLITYTYRTVEGNDLVWKVGAISRVDRKEIADWNDIFIDELYNVETEVYRVPDTNEDYGKFTVSSKYYGNRNWIFTCAGKGGLKIYHHNKLVDNDNFNGTDKIHRLDLKAQWDKTTVCSTLQSHDNTFYLYTAGPAGCYKSRLDLNGADITAVLTPQGRRPSGYVGENRVSTNYVCSFNNSRVYVAGGEEGFYWLNWDDTAFTPAND